MLSSQQHYEILIEATRTGIQMQQRNAVAVIHSVKSISWEVPRSYSKDKYTANER